MLGSGCLFDVGIDFTSDRQDILDAALGLFPGRALAVETSVCVALRSYDANGEVSAERSGVEDGCLTWNHGGVLCHADGKSGKGFCFLPLGLEPDGELFAEILDTVILFLVAQAGRTPLHASAVMLGDTAFVLAGRSGSGKSSLALAADGAALEILSDDTVYVQTEPRLRIWSRPRAIHVFEKDAPQGAKGSLRHRSGRWKRALPISTVRPMAERTVLCVLEPGTATSLAPLAVEDAVQVLTQAPEPGYEFYGARSADAVRALARGGCWRLTLSDDPKDAIDLLRRSFGAGEPAFHHRYTWLVSEIERHFPVDRWRLGDVPVWPLARFALYVDMHRAAFGGSAPRERPLFLRLGGALARPLINRWRSRHDAAHQLYTPKVAHAVLLGDGVSLDRVDGAYEDRFGEPVVAALERMGKSTFVMQPGDLSRLPWRRASFAAGAIEARAFLASIFQHRQPELPRHGELMAFLAAKAIAAPSLEVRALGRRARHVAAAATLFERILRRVNPVMAFVVNAAAGLGPSFVLACRRRGILSVDLQRCPRAGAPMAHGWSGLPPTGYATLPAVFWTWDAGELPRLPPSSWHRDMHGGHTQILPFLDDDNPATIAWDGKIAQVGPDHERDILVALQPLGGTAVWNALADAIAVAPSSWRWWIRRHPAMRPEQDAAFAKLLSLSNTNVIIDPPLPLPALLRHTSVLVSLASGAAVEASWFGVPAIFLSPEASGPFGALLASHAARLVRLENLTAEIGWLPRRSVRPSWNPPPPLTDTLNHLEKMAREYGLLCAQDRS